MRLNSALAMATARVNDLMLELDSLKQAESKSHAIVHSLKTQHEQVVFICEISLSFLETSRR